MPSESSTDTTPAESVFRLIYRSQSLIDPAQRSPELASIFTTARTNNRGQSITGALMEQKVANRTFGRWAMAEVATDDRPDRRLVSKPGSGEIVKMGKDPSITPEQEQVLAFMRDAARDGASH